ncbi:hypothetical protein V6257_19495 [Pseudoalteromonas issachenkonii]|jgi:hypothetical protein|uniref:Uncharacterized protein n=1 Tax=Pseudoalteromonas issachenkonii TaxID=152297 RepID=A0ABU9H5W7_9GAMM
MELSFQTESVALLFLVLFSLTVLPVKIGATVFGATNNEFKYCAISVFLGTLIAIICSKLIGGFSGLLAGYIGVSIVYSRVLGLSLSWSFLFTFGILFIQVATVQALTRFGIFT